MKDGYHTTDRRRLDGRLIVLLLAGALVFFTHTCRSSRQISTSPKTVTDTVYTTSTDTVWKEKIKYVQLEIPVPDTIYINNGSVSDTTDSTHLGYVLDYRDSLMDAEFKVEVDGVLISHKFNYVAKYPQYIHTRDTFRITSNTEREFKRQLFLGLEVGGTESSFNLSPSVTLKGKNNFLYTYRYDLLSRSHNVGVQKLIKFK